ncbi:phage tail termination protein [Streptomyces sp. C10-9-1]|uniref:phage tail termination protein n=1 Tax=Streptomyces sp. C10-9-1 TaxID=1859285 RepID=UPI003F49F69A
MWPDAEIELVARLKARLGVRVVTELPGNLEDVLPVVQVQSVGGTDDGVRLARALVSVDVYGATRKAASDLAELVRQELVVRLRGVRTDAAVFGRVSTVAAPAWRPYENPALRRSGATYELFYHPVGA